MSLFSTEHGYSELPKVLGISCAAKPRQPVQQGWIVQEFVKCPRGVSENRKFLLEIDVNTPQKYSVQTYICLIRSGRGVGRYKGDVYVLVSSGRWAIVLSCIQVPQYMPAAPAVI